MKDNEWKKVCAACAEGTPPARCAYYGEPNGCNAPTLGKHPEGNLAERLQEALEKAERRIAELERAPGSAAAMREALAGFLYWAKRMDEKGCSMREFVDFVREKTESALSAPARNCDSFATLNEARQTFQDMRGHRIWADVELWDSMDEAGAFVRWLFAPAEGGAK